MTRISISPRPPINQGIDSTNEMVLAHTQTYNRLLSAVDSTHTIQGGPIVVLNPYGTAPLSGTIGLWAEDERPVTVEIYTPNSGVVISYQVQPTVGANVLPLVGLAPEIANEVHIIDEDSVSYITTVTTAALPAVDADIPPSTGRKTGFPIVQITVPLVNPPQKTDELYFISISRRYNIGVDYKGVVRWYTTLDIPSFNLLRLANGTFLSTGNDFDTFKRLYNYDMTGRVYTVYILDNNAHHSLYEMPNGEILMPSEYTGQTSSDGLSIISLSDGLETAYYDIREVMDTNRVARPQEPTAIDWIHINQSFYNATNDLLITSGRHQAVWGMKANDGTLVFILGNREGWSADFQQYLLTPVDETGTPIYDFSQPADVARADKEFWNWGQHAVLEVPNNTPGIVEFFLFDNGNYRSRTDADSLLPNDNWSRIVRYLVDTNNMTVQMLFEYGRVEVASRGYSCYVSNQQVLANGNYLVNFGGHIVDENGRNITENFGYSDINDPLAGSQAMGLLTLQEIDPATKLPVFELTSTSGKLKNQVDDGPDFHIEFYSFRSFKFPIIQ
ncbi:aryl-sulfate sulfotransferase [Ruminococcaceae bacterium OttesenSCG-928-L11]|nr:aryl-sulfate sulfotransferase [Ruminococcaceae bacterium OttesenSCG-928-L11]